MTETLRVGFESLKDIAFRELQSDVCACGNVKKKNQSFCYPCFSQLPARMRSSLWRSLNDGYPEVHDAAKTFLRAETSRLDGKK